MKRFVTLILLFFILLPSTQHADAQEWNRSIYFDHPPAPVDSSTFFTVMSYNIRYGTADDGPNRWELRREALAHQIAEVDPDLIGFQEALRFQLDYLHEMLPGYAEFGKGRDDGDTLGEYTAIFYKEERFISWGALTRWFSDTPTIPGSMSWGNRIPRIYTVATFIDKRTNRFFRHYNVHLDHESQKSREKSIERLINLITGSEGTNIFTGDFNAGTKNPAMHRLLTYSSSRSGSLPAVDTWQKAHNYTAPGTFNGFSGDSSGTKIDFVLIEASRVNVIDANVLTNQVEGRWPSDHFPVIARLQWRQ